MSPGLDRKSTQKAKAFLHKASQRLRYTEEREAAVAEEDAFWGALSQFIEANTGHIPDLRSMRERDVQAWCTAFHQHRSTQQTQVGRAPRYGRAFRRKYWGMNA